MSASLADVTAVTPDLPLALRHRAPRVVVVGDVMLDRWWVGSSHRLSREAPAPVVEVSGRHEVPGGAANTAMNLAALGADVRLVGLVGADEAGPHAPRRCWSRPASRSAGCWTHPRSPP